MIKKGKYWVNVPRIEFNKTGEVLFYGDEFPDSGDESHLEKLLSKERITLIEPEPKKTTVSPSKKVPNIETEKEKSKLTEDSISGDK